ncbi:MAG: sigma-54 dependent transcriptional regulator [Acidobacteriia bacterium]|nr:sigma-54 dependent transcriptional regulator [Terriglobia bacterium]
MRNHLNILVVDDDSTTLDLLQEALTAEAHSVTTSQSGEEALNLGRTQSFDVVISDIKMGMGVSGLDVLKSFRQITPTADVILMTAFGSMESTIEAVKAGAYDYISKPFRLEEILLILERLVEKRRLQNENLQLRHQLEERFSLSSIIGRTPAMLEVFKKIGYVADGRSTVLITGDSGTGKELVAKAIHYNSQRAQKKFMAINCGALTETLLESELFGHVRGAFTGAMSNKKGIFEEAEGGTVFLDEVSEMSTALQVKLLRVLDEQEVRPVGGSGTIKFDVRIIAASNKNLLELAENGTFRHDLLYRLNVINIHLPPLRERRDDIPLLVAHFLKKFSQPPSPPISIAEDAMTVLCSYHWPGNIRELENTIEAASALTRTSVITAKELPPRVSESPVPSGPEALFADLPSLDELERRYLIRALEAAGNNKSRAAEMMGINRKTLTRMVERHGIKV